MKDAEEGASHPQSIGFANLSDFIVRDKDRSVTLYRGYLSLASRDLLYRQSELRNLQEQLSRYDREDAENARVGKREFKDMAMNWQLLCEGVPSSPAGRRKKLILEIRDSLKEYQEALIRHAEIMRLHRPSRSVHDAFKEYFWGSGRQPTPKLLGISARLYGLRDDDTNFDIAENESSRNDLLSLGQIHAEDKMTQFLRGALPILWRRRGQDSEGVMSLSDYRIGMAVATINIVVVAGLLFGAVFSLYYIKSVEKRLGVLAGYTVVFAAAVTVLSTASRGEVFGASAAYAAVLVVFVSGGLGDA